MRRALGLGLALLMMASVPAMAKGKKKETLYKRLGGKKAITAVVDDFVGRCAKDDRISSFFAATAADQKRMDKFKQKLVVQICQVTGGPCKYKGKTMKVAHAGMGIQSEHFDALVEDLKATLTQFKVAEKDQNTIFKTLGKMKKDIVQPARNTASEGAK